MVTLTVCIQVSTVLAYYYFVSRYTSFRVAKQHWLQLRAYGGIGYRL